MIRSIIFDIGGTVFTKGKTLFIDYLSELLDRDRELIVEVIDGQSAQEYRRGLISSDEYWSQVVAKLNTTIPLALLEQKWFSFYRPQDGMIKVLKGLTGFYRLYYISDNLPRRVEYLRKEYDIFQYFDGGLFSYEVGKLKSDNPGLLDLLVKKYQLFPLETLYLDDKKSNLVRGERIGMPVLLYSNVENLLSEIEKIGVSITVDNHS